MTKITSQRGYMRTTEWLFHWSMIICTLGLWYPFYAHRRRRIERTSTIWWS
jgi:hypothetical protein